MRRIFIILSIVSVLPFAANAQLSKLMSKYHEKNGVTVTQLDKSLYGLYQRNNLPPEAKRTPAKTGRGEYSQSGFESDRSLLSEKAIGQFREILDKPEKYKLIKSRTTSSESNRSTRTTKRTSDRPGGLEPKPTTGGYHRTPGRHSTG